MIKKISQLNRLPEQYYDKDITDADLLRKKNEMLFEVSYETADTSNPTAADEVKNYYTSYSITLSSIGDALGTNEMRELLSTILDGGLSTISGDLTIGRKGAGKDDRVSGHEYYPDLSSYLTIYTPLDLQNNAKIHGIAEFHNNVLIECDKDIDRDHPILIVNGVAKFNNTIDGTAYRAQWGDLAEYYSADAEYEPGTLVKFGGDNEITIATDKANAIVTSKPGIVLNSGYCMKNPTAIALTGRVPVKVNGPVRKFDKIVLSRTRPGIGIANNHAFPVEVIGRSLEDNSDKDIKTVLCVVSMNLN